MAKGFGVGISEYKEIAQGLAKSGVLSEEQAALFRELAGYRNRMVHFYHEVSDPELYEICSGRLVDIEAILKAIVIWVQRHPEMIDKSLRARAVLCFTP